MQSENKIKGLCLIWIIKNYWILVSLLNFGDAVLFAWPQIFSIRQNVPDLKKLNSFCLIDLS